MQKLLVLFDCEVTKEVEDELQMSCLDESDLTVETPMKEVTTREWLSRDDLLVLLVTKSFTKITINGFTQASFSDEDQQKQIEELKEKLRNCSDYFSEIQSKIDDIKSSVSDIEYFADEVSDYACYGEDETDYDE